MDNSFQCIYNNCCDTINETKYYNELKYIKLSDEDKVEDNNSNNNLYITSLCINDCTMTKSILESSVGSSIYGNNYANISTTTTTYTDKTNIEDVATSTYAQDCLKFVSLNVSGLVSRMNDPIFRIELQKYDFICLSETKCDNADIKNVLKKRVFIFGLQNSNTE